jgi:hypothetical protein
MQTLQIQLPDTINIDMQEIQMLLASRVGRVSDSVTRHFEAHASGYG